MAAPVLGVVHPAVSPDGKQIAVSYQGGIWVFTPGSGEFLRKTGGGPWDIEPVWSPDGTKIAFYRTGNFRGGPLKLIDAASGKIVPLPKAAGGEGRLFFSPDGKRLLGTISDGRFTLQIRWLDLDTGIATPLEIGPRDQGQFRRKRIKYALSPSGGKIVFAVHRDEPNEQGGYRGPHADIYLCDAAGAANQKQIFTWPARIYDLVFDGENSLLAVTDLGAIHNDIWRIPLQNPLRDAERLTTDFTDDERPAIDSGRGRLYWTNNAKGGTSIRVLNRQTGAITGLLPAKRDYQKPVGTLELTLAETGRVAIRNKETGDYVFPPGAIYRIGGNSVGHYYTNGKSNFDIPSGEYDITVFRGPEYTPWRSFVQIRSSAVTRVSAAAKRWVNQAERGWWSGENHIHANYGYGEWYNTPRTILRQCAGENLNVCNAVIGNSDGEAVFDREFFRGQIDPRSTGDVIMYWGQEFRATLWGHMTLSNLSQLVEPIMTGFLDTTNPFDVPTNGDIGQRVIDQSGALASYTHPAGNRLDLYDQPYAAKGMPVDAALGKVLLMDVMGHTYDGSIQLWYKLMNCGLKVVATSGTDCFLNRVRSAPPGWARTYVYLPGGLNYSDWIEGQRRGQSFITNSAMLTFEHEGKPAAGKSIVMQSPGEIEIFAAARSQYPLDRVELVHNGQVIRQLEISGDKLGAEFAGKVSIPASGWLALRAHGPAHADVMREPNAHSNALWIDIPGTPNPQAEKDAAYFLRWIDRLQSDFEQRQRWPAERDKQRVLEQLNRARDYYRR